MYNGCQRYKRLDFETHLREKDRRKRKEEISLEAEYNRERAYKKKHGKYDFDGIPTTQEEYIEKYFAVS